MYILPFVLTLTLVLSFIGIEKLAQFKNQSIIAQSYQTFLDAQARYMFNLRQNHLCDKYDKSHRQLSFRYFLNKKLRESQPELAKQYRQVVIDFLKILYGQANFFTNLANQRPQLIEELLIAIEQSADALEAPHEIKSIEDMVHLNLGDAELQNLFYRMLKGTVAHNDELILREKTYVSLLTYVHFNQSAVQIQLAPKSLLSALFASEEVVLEILKKRNEEGLTDEAFKNEFLEKRKSGLSEALFNFKVTKSNKNDYN